MAYEVKTKIRERELQFMNDLFEIGSAYSASAKESNDGHYDLLHFKANLEYLLEDVKYVIEVKEKLAENEIEQIKQAIKEAKKEKE